MKSDNKNILLNASAVIDFIDNNLKIKDDFEKIAILETTSESIKKILQAKSLEDVMKATLYKVLNNENNN